MPDEPEQCQRGAGEIAVSMHDALLWQDLLTEMAEGPTAGYRADEARTAADGIANYLRQVIDPEEQGEI